MFQGPYVRDVFFSFCVYSFDFLTVSSKMSSDSSGFQTNHLDSLTGFVGRGQGGNMKRQFQNCELFTKETIFKCTD